MATLTVKNNTGEDLAFKTPAGVVKVKAGATSDLTDKQLSAPVLVDAVASGQISFLPPADEPNWDEIVLARSVLPPIVRGTASKLTQLTTRFEKSRSDLVRLREAFNSARSVVAAQLDAAKAAVKGWPELEKAVQAFIVATEQENAEEKKAKEELKAAEKKLDELKEEDLQTSHRTLEQWYTDRVAQETAVREAREAERTIRKTHENPLVPEVRLLTLAVANLQAIVKEGVIGPEIPELK